jgi:hypothetical protein
LGLSLGGAVALGVLLGRRGATEQASFPGLAELRLKAAATHGGETFAIATGPIDDEAEGLFTLDFVTGDLMCTVINPRNYSFGGQFGINITSALPAEKAKKPSYLIATGSINARTGSAGCICYVVDANTGDVAAFSFPWTKSLTSVGVPQMQPMRQVGKWQARSVNLRQ